MPKLPDPRDLKPFPNALSRDFPGHDGPVVALDVSTDGQWLATADEPGTVRLWEVSTGRCEWASSTCVPGPIAVLAWNPNSEHHVLAVSGKDGCYLVDAGTARGDDKAMTAALLAGDGDDDDQGSAQDDGQGDDEHVGVDKPEQRTNAQNVAIWTTLKSAGRSVTRVALAEQARTVAWHAKGDYLVTVSPEAIASMQCLIHRVSKRQSQAPLKRGDKGGQIQAATFHPNKPFLFVATRTMVRVYHLTQQTLVKTLKSGMKWISCIHVHHSGDHVAVGSRDAECPPPEEGDRWLDSLTACACADMADMNADGGPMPVEDIPLTEDGETPVRDDPACESIKAPIMDDMDAQTADGGGFGGPQAGVPIRTSI